MGQVLSLMEMLREEPDSRALESIWRSNVTSMGLEPETWTLETVWGVKMVSSTSVSSVSDTILTPHTVSNVQVSGSNPILVTFDLQIDSSALLSGSS
ncbi:MAG: hypothetical protein AAFV78_06315, partial [Bacteroidota bacterium]